MEKENISEKFVSYDIIYSSLQLIHCLNEKLKFINYSSNEYEDKIKVYNEENLGEIIYKLENES